MLVYSIFICICIITTVVAIPISNATKPPLEVPDEERYTITNLTKIQLKTSHDENDPSVHMMIEFKIRENGKMEMVESSFKSDNCDSCVVDVLTSRKKGYDYKAIINEAVRVHVFDEHSLAHKPSHIPADYVFKKDFGYYKYHEDPESWFNSRTICEDENAHLAIINSQDEADMLIDMFDINDCAQVGIHQMFGENFYVSVKDRQLSKLGFSNWCPGNPSNDYSKKCVNIKNNDDAGCLKNSDCDEYKAKFICKIDLK